MKAFTTLILEIHQIPLLVEVWVDDLFVKWKILQHTNNYILCIIFYVDAECYINGTDTTNVDSGNCECKTGYKGEKCNQCDKGHYDINDGTDEPLICSGKKILFECID